MGLFSKKQVQPKEYSQIIDSILPNPRKELAKSPYDSKLGLNMARDARKVLSGQMKIADFHKVYSSSLTKEFGKYYAAGEEQQKKNNGKGPKWVMVIDLQKCVGCDTCTVSCKAENRTPPGISYNVVMEQMSGDFPNVSLVNLPRPCMQCDQPPCVQVCPTRATYKLDNGIVAIDNDRCIGCRYCIVACPYGARSYDFGDSYEEMLGYNDVTSPEYGVDRGERKKGKTPVGTIRKCSFCFHRLERGEEPACVETCIGDARFFGDINDPNSTVSKLAASPRAFRLKEELGTEPSVIYLR
ncbi:4Fe-4S dicluster domain-containing protein [Bacillus aquiflavi]|uniref:4Fe-4S dicluster domain-containing protein n=1 Tax=Bacillus aquiflavi TaxID=2672567 RepID=A0A6B3VXS3_9BACI|nr:4Fe-4S dicluster domain-containing protein [Bacillus aquiflavi]MBA4536740.1 4Fe-4S dicluster domain-containing protein [Bacillus aquiflavi]NEY81107.1 4Fe-4S dicluster domain-containing protein [Bacillus aquiflavi]UAC48772.1 4Fe-4S dicluster domain-containing protein [Bacillus aquiflavi]